MSAAEGDVKEVTEEVKEEETPAGEEEMQEGGENGGGEGGEGEDANAEEGGDGANGEDEDLLLLDEVGGDDKKDEDGKEEDEADKAKAKGEKFILPQDMNSMKFHEICLSVTFYFLKKDSKRCCDTTTPESIRTKDESKRGLAFAFIFGVN